MARQPSRSGITPGRTPVGKPPTRPFLTGGGSLRRWPASCGSSLLPSLHVSSHVLHPGRPCSQTLPVPLAAPHDIALVARQVCSLRARQNPVLRCLRDVKGYAYDVDGLRKPVEESRHYYPGPPSTTSCPWLPSTLSAWLSHALELTKQCIHCICMVSMAI